MINVNLLVMNHEYQTTPVWVGRLDCEYRGRLRERQRCGAINFHRAAGTTSKIAWKLRKGWI